MTLNSSAGGGGILSTWNRKSAATRPGPGEYAPYYETYISKVKGSDIVGILGAQRLQMAHLFAARSERDGNFRYAPDKWTVKEVLGHVNDAERIFAYRACGLRVVTRRRFPRSSRMTTCERNFAERTLVDLAEEFELVRAASIALFKSLQKEAWQRRGVASKNEVSVRALAFIVAGTSCITGRSWRSGTSRRFRAPESCLAMNADAGAIHVAAMQLAAVRLLITPSCAASGNHNRFLFP